MQRMNADAIPQNESSLLFLRTVSHRRHSCVQETWKRFPLTIRDLLRSLDWHTNLSKHNPHMYGLSHLSCCCNHCTSLGCHRTDLQQDSRFILWLFVRLREPTWRYCNRFPFTTGDTVLFRIVELGSKCPFVTRHNRSIGTPSLWNIFLTCKALTAIGTAATIVPIFCVTIGNSSMSYRNKKNHIDIHPGGFRGFAHGSSWVTVMDTPTLTSPSSAM